MPRRPGRVGRLEHVVAGAGIVVPAVVGLEVHRRQLPDLARIVDARFEAARLLLRGHLQPIFDEHDAGFDDRLLELGRDFEEALHRVHRAKLHHALDAGAVVPAAIEDHDLAGGGHVADVALDIHLRLLPLGRRGQRDDAENARTDALGDRLDHAALAGAVAALEQHADLQALVDDPELQLDEFGMQLRELALIGLAGQLFARRGVPPLHDLLFDFLLSLRHGCTSFPSFFTTRVRLPSKAPQSWMRTGDVTLLPRVDGGGASGLRLGRA